MTSDDWKAVGIYVYGTGRMQWWFQGDRLGLTSYDSFIHYLSAVYVDVPDAFFDQRGNIRAGLK